jgi:hypothetical protein
VGIIDGVAGGSGTGALAGGEIWGWAASPGGFAVDGFAACAMADPLGAQMQSAATTRPLVIVRQPSLTALFIAA